MTKPPLILLHGALGSKEQFNDILSPLENSFEVHLLDFEGHGEAGPTDSPFRVSYFAENVLGLLDVHGIEKANIFGYSMGGYVALTLAHENPGCINKVATLGTILSWNKKIAARECGYLNPSKMKEKVPHFVDRLTERHIAGWERVVNRTREMLQYLGNEPNIKDENWKDLAMPVRLHVGDRDTTVELGNTVENCRKMRHGELCVLPGSGHPFEDINKKVLLASLLDFF